MAITIKHAKTDTIADWTQADLDAQIALGNFPSGTTLADIVLPSDWNDNHTFTGTLGVSNGGTGATTLTGYVKGNGTSAFTATTTIPNTDITGLGTMSTQNANNVTITGGSISGTTVSGYIPTTEKGVANGVATLDAGGKVPVSQIPALGDLNYQGTWNASTNSPTLTSSVGTKGYYYVVNVAGSTNLNGITDWQVGDWAVYNGSVWQKIDNTDAVTSVNGYTGTVVLTYTDVGAAPATSGTSILYGNGSGGFSNVTVGSGLSFSTGTLSSTAVSMVYPGAGIPNSTGSAWGTSYSTTGTGTVIALQNSPSLTSPTIDGANPYIQFNNGSTVTLAAGRMWYDGSTGSWNLGMGNGNITQQVGEEIFVYGRASDAITEGQVVAVTGSYGASGVVTFAPAPAGLTNDNVIVGIATENIAKNDFGRVTSFGTVHGLSTSPGFADGDVIWYDPTTVGGYTKTKPTAPNIKCQVGIITKAAGGTNGTIQVSIIHGTSLGGTDSNVNIVSATNGQILTYDTSNSYWKNTSLTAGTGISVSAATGGTLTVTNSAPDQTVSITGSGGAVVTGTYPNFTITTPSGTVTSVTGTAPISSTGGATPAISISQATTSTNGYLSSTDWNTFNNKQPAGTYVTSVSATSPVTSTGGTTPTIAMPAATTSVSGYLTSTDWNTFNSKGSGSVTSVSVVSANGLAGTVATATTTPAITLSTTVTGLLKGNGTAISAATSGTDYAPATSGTSILYGNGSGGFSNVTIGTGVSFAGGTLSATGSGGTVTSVSALTLGTSGTDLSSTVANSTTTPVITLNVPTASATNRGALSSTDWTTFNNKAPSVTYTSTYVPYGQGTTTPALSSSFTFNSTTGVLTAPEVNASNGIVVNSKTVGTSYTIPSGSSAMSAGPITVSSGVTVTVSSGSRWVVL